jgi:hypothetical protein
MFDLARVGLAHSTRPRPDQGDRLGSRDRADVDVV